VRALGVGTISRHSLQTGREIKSARQSKLLFHPLLCASEGDRFEAGLMQSELRLRTLLLEGQGQDSLGRVGLPCAYGPAPTITSRSGGTISHRRPATNDHRRARACGFIRAARAQLVFKAPCSEVARTEPMDMCSDSVHALKHERAGRIEDALDMSSRSPISAAVFQHLYLLLAG